jgi:hypothetical protein
MGKDLQIFEMLIRNALDFLEKSIDEFDKHPKFSLLHFCIGFELLLKTRLAYEHWALIVRDLDKVNSKIQFENGKVVTIGY